MSTAVAKNFQVGSDGTATNNFTIRQPATPDGTVRIANGNSGTTTDLVTVTSAGNVGIGTSSPGAKLDVTGTAAISGAVTLSGGTANGVSYLNASKVLTTGSALTFDGTNLGVGTASPNAKLVVAGGSEYITNTAGNAAGIEIAGNGNTPTTTSLFIGQGSTSLGFIYQRANADLAFGVNNTEQMRLTSTGLGVGTSTPAAKLQVGDGTATTEIRIDGDGGSGNGGFIRGYKDTANPSWFVGDLNPIAGGANSGLCLYSYGATPQVFYTNGSERMRLDSSGNLGLGVTPSAWRTDVSFKALQMPGGSFTAYMAGGVDQTPGIAANGYVDAGGTWRYINSRAASWYIQNGGMHIWYNAASGTAGNAISFTQAMTLDASSNLSIGTTANLLSSGTRTTVSISGSSSSAVALGVGGTRYGHVYADSTSTELSATSGYLYFTAGSAERARITSGGDLLVGTTTTQGGGGSCIARSGNNAQALQMLHTGTIPFGAYINYTGAAPNGTGNNFIQCNDTAALRFAVASNGGISNYQGNNVNLSDRREKTNFAPAKSYLDTICAIPVQTFNYADQNMEEDPGLTLGVVAQDVQAVAPELVMESNWGTKDEPKMRLSIYQTDLQYALMKALQELKAELDTVKAELQTLKGT